MCGVYVYVCVMHVCMVPRSLLYACLNPRHAPEDVGLLVVYEYR